MQIPVPHKPTYDTFWYWIKERQEIFFRRLAGAPKEEWTQDPILQRYKFTNVYRASDRVSQYLIKNVIYGRSCVSADEVFFRTVLFKIFCRESTWELLDKNFDLTWENFKLDDYCVMLSQANGALYTSAYQMPTKTGQASYRAHLKMLTYFMRDMIWMIRDPQALYSEFLGYEMMGPFLSFQYLIDWSYSPFAAWGENEFVIAGPGALDGIGLIFGREWERICKRNPTSAHDTMVWLVQDQDNHEFKDLFGRALTLVDIEHALCEVSKYCREAHPDLCNGKQIKSVYSSGATPRALPHWYPPKWGINERVEREFSNF